MQPERCASELAKMISRLSRAKVLPENWDPEKFSRLIAEYRKLITVIEQQGGKNKKNCLPMDDSQMKRGDPSWHDMLVNSAPAPKAAEGK